MKISVLHLFCIVVFAHINEIAGRRKRTVLFPTELATLLQKINCNHQESSHNLRSLQTLSCDSMIGQYLWPPDNKCYTLLQQGPCQHNEWLVIDYEENLTCKQKPCLNCNLRNQPFNLRCPSSFVPIINEYGERECDCIVGEVYHPQTGQCYPRFSRGPCPPGSIINMIDNDDTGYGSCQVNNCPHENMTNINPNCEDNMIKENLQNCYHIDSQGPCQNGDTLNINNVLTKPSCISISDFALISNCSKGSRRDLMGRCRRRRDTRPRITRERNPIENANALEPGIFNMGRCPENYIFLSGRCFRIRIPS